ncbi:MAG TPA: cytochrome c [Caldithrix abyssi]|uniref:Cytochrome c n=1 Tax=Caldithrix abyssi TaxID=187145 RepID=A0A7V4U2K7_CALAY|nr:cytochrome c [Caldithrix abyssi]
MIAGIFLLMTVALFIASCAASKPIADKPGALLWGENCVRCHNAPSPSAFSDTQWEAIGKHMRVRANLTEDEVNKIVEFLSMANQ